MDDNPAEIDDIGPEYKMKNEGVEGDDENSSEANTWLRRAERLYRESTDYYESSLFQSWRDNINHFHSEHEQGSKYNRGEYKHRSNVFRPKPRSAVRTLEAQAAAALFSNNDLLDVRGVDPGNKRQATAAKLHKSLLQHRLETTIPWFLTVLGAYQDTHVYGVCISKQYWDYRTKKRKEMVPVVAEDGTPEVDDNGVMLGEEVDETEVLADKPAVDLLAPDNFRYAPSADWRDPVNTSPYIIERVPMHAGDVLAMMDDETNGGWREYPLGKLVAHGAGDLESETVKDAREGRREDAHDVHNADEYSVIWVHYNIIKDAEGTDWQFWTVGTGLLLTTPAPLKEVELLGRDRYRVGFSGIETHRPHPNGTIALNRPLTKMLNDVTNQRLDNVKLVLNKRYAIRRGSKIDLGALMRNVPGGGVMMDDVRNDYAVMETPDVTQSSYVEQDRLALESDELLGTFSQSTVGNNRALNETVGGMNMMSQGANQVQELALRTFTETWVEPVLRTLVRLEANFETDDTVLALASGQADLHEEIDDELMMQDLVVKVNVGMGNTDPTQRLARFVEPVRVMSELPTFAAKLDYDEIGKEMFALAGKGDGNRFIMDEEQLQKKAEEQGQEIPPEIQVKQQELQLKQQELQLKQQEQQYEFQLKQQEQQRKQQEQQFEQQRSAAELQHKREKDHAELALKHEMTIAEFQSKLGIKESELELKAQETAAKIQSDRDKTAANILDRREHRSMMNMYTDRKYGGEESEE